MTQQSVLHLAVNWETLVLNVGALTVVDIENSVSDDDHSRSLQQRRRVSRHRVVSQRGAVSPSRARPSSRVLRRRRAVPAVAARRRGTPRPRPTTEAVTRRQTARRVSQS